MCVGGYFLEILRVQIRQREGSEDRSLPPLTLNPQHWGLHSELKGRPCRGEHCEPGSGNRLYQEPSLDPGGNQGQETDLLGLLGYGALAEWRGS